jgi:hypothetical protein
MKYLIDVRFNHQTKDIEITRCDLRRLKNAEIP